MLPLTAPLLTSCYSLTSFIAVADEALMANVGEVSLRRSSDSSRISLFLSKTVRLNEWACTTRRSVMRVRVRL